MNKERTLVIEKSKCHTSTHKELMSIALERGFEKTNAMTFVIHSKPGEMMHVEELIKEVTEFLEPGKFEMIIVGQYKENASYSKLFIDDLTSFCHVHILVKGRYAEVKSYADKWNTYSVNNAKELFYASPIFGTIEENITYMLEDLKESKDFSPTSYGTYFKNKNRQKNEVISSFLGGLSKLWWLYTQRLRQRAKALAKGFKSVLFARAIRSFWWVKSTLIGVFFYNEPNAPPY